MGHFFNSKKNQLMRNKKTYIEYNEAMDLIKDYVLPVVTKLDYQISYKDIHADLPSDPRGAYEDQWLSWDSFLKASKAS